jgi:hypothetical protein
MSPLSRWVIGLMTINKEQFIISLGVEEKEGIDFLLIA